ncbi:dihydroxyacetone kinase family protein [Paracoccus pantotrophus]|uniref:dihydroxyacetone kinase family protein n=1 Tax=Paracoccus pantotrophus TaxID=82367 RepID=UPI0004635C4F|nr:dihydroxyacetone kinase family protein [Paracoccus pantotrophus]RDD97786.1 dihydroxyacetone kinase subunit DhaK [Paracoccus pantotrophus]WGR66180.1 dihydroxyacetone kinase subunit DhaK [Paracoccus pantotrophus]
MKKLINDPASVVREMLEGFVAGTPATGLLADETVVVRTDLADRSARKVAVISGGGSGHEPAHAGYVGQGMLSAAVAGDVFTSPSTDAVLAAIRHVSGPAGALLIVKNYTGDRLNFGLAAEFARSEGIPVETVIVADDVALHETVPADRRRGIAGTVLVHKIAGAAAEEGRSLSEVADIARRAASSVGSMGIALGSCTLPAVGHPGFELGEDEIEVGLGIHGEPGVRRETISSVDRLAEQMLDVIVADRKLDGAQPVALLVNGLGSTPPMELLIAQRAALADLRGRGVKVVRVWSGTLLSALNMPGFSYSVLPVDERMLGYLDEPCSAPAWPGNGLLNQGDIVLASEVPDEEIDPGVTPDDGGRQVRQAAFRAAAALIDAEPELTRLDSLAGDGDLGQSMQRGSEAVKSLADHAFATAETGLAATAGALRRAIGGSSGPFYATALLRASRVLSGKSLPRPADWAEAFDVAVQSISDLGGAKPGDRTMIDALRPAADIFRARIADNVSIRDAWSDAIAAAEKGLEETRSMRAGAGRASYLGDRSVGIPDGGAAAVVIWMKALAGD